MLQHRFKAEEQSNSRIFTASAADAHSEAFSMAASLPNLLEPATALEAAVVVVA
jgi:hypothetical protein